jgi:putative RNA 2'-phosphotransferase
MIRDCETHGYFRDERCPICGEEGKFLMSPYEVERLGRIMAGILRHGRFEPDMDDQGFVGIREIIDEVRERNPRMKWLRPHHIEALVETDPKGRYQISSGDVRATYGHTIVLDLRHPTDNIPYTLYYPTTEEECDILLETGLLPTDRTHVHLSRTFFDAVKAGSVRTDDPIILEIDVLECEENGVVISRAAKTVFLCDHVPPEFLTVVTEDEFYDDEDDDEDGGTGEDGSEDESYEDEDDSEDEDDGEG